MVREKISASLLFGAVIVLGITVSSTGAHAEPFDKPLQTKVVDLGRSPHLMPNDDRHIKLTCSYYPKFMIKELNDPGNKGALWIALVPAKPGHISACTRTHGPEDNVFNDLDGHYWDGYFGGVKRDLVFLYDSDGTNGGIPFTVFNSKTYAKVFRDSVSLLDSHVELHHEIDFVQASDTQMTLRYLRVVTGTCSVPKDGSACWNKFKEQLGLRLGPMPKCSDEPGKYARTEPSVIAYPVETSLFPKPSIKAIDNPVRCYPPS
jgi:hypothetical protein